MISEWFLNSLFIGAGAEIVPFDSDDTDDEDSPSPSSTLQSQASRSTISSSYGSEYSPTTQQCAAHILYTLFDSELQKWSFFKNNIFLNDPTV